MDMDAECTVVRVLQEVDLAPSVAVKQAHGNGTPKSSPLQVMEMLCGRKGVLLHGAPLSYASEHVKISLLLSHSPFSFVLHHSIQCITS